MSAAPRWLDDQQQQTWQDLLTVVIGLPALLDRQMERDAGLSNFEYSVLARLSSCEDWTMRLSELAMQCNCTQPRLSKAMTRFEKQGWVSRTADPRNGRYTLAQLTETGFAKVVESAPAHVDEVRRLVFEPLSPSQQRHLAATLARIARTVREELRVR